MSVVSAFTTAILPIVAIAAVGYVLGRRLDIEVDGLNSVALNVFLPALVFHGIATTDVSGGTVLTFCLAVVAYILVMMGLTYVGGRVVSLPEGVLPGVVLASAFPNSGFVGIPLVGFVYGDFGRTLATLFLSVQSVVLYTLGVYVISAGTEGQTSAWSAIREVFRLPLVYAVVLAAVVRLVGIDLPADGTILSITDTVGSASIPLMLTVVGIQLADVDLGGLRETVFPAVLKLGVAPVVGAVIALVVGFSDPRIANVLVLECATPVAVTPLALTIAYGDPSEDTLSVAEYMSTTILVTTLLSVVVLTGLVVAVQSGFPF